MTPDSRPIPSAPTTPQGIRVCATCGLIQTLPAVPPKMRPCCSRCGSRLPQPAAVRRSNSRTAAVALAALILYPFAVSLPMIRVERFGHHTDASILEGISTLFASGHVFVAAIVGLCSVILPLGKLISLLILSAGGSFLQHRHRALTYHIVEWTGRWGMLDVLLVAILVAVLKIGDFMEVTAGPAALAFTLCVLMSLLAAAVFDPHVLWQSEPQPGGQEARTRAAAHSSNPDPSTTANEAEP